MLRDKSIVYSQKNRQGERQGHIDCVAMTLLVPSALVNDLLGNYRHFIGARYSGIAAFE